MGGFGVAGGQDMWPFSARRVVLNDMGFLGDGDDIDAVKDTEAEFNVVTSDAEAEVMRTVYDLFKAVWARLPASEKQAEFAELAVWHRLCTVLRRINGFSGPIDLETTFFAEHAKARKHHG